MCVSITQTHTRVHTDTQTRAHRHTNTVDAHSRHCVSLEETELCEQATQFTKEKRRDDEKCDLAKYKMNERKRFKLFGRVVGKMMRSIVIIIDTSIFCCDIPMSKDMKQCD